VTAGAVTETKNTGAILPVRKAAPYLFHSQTTSLCETCLKLVPAKVLIEGSDVWYQKRCPEHGVQKTIISTDADYWKRTKDYLKPGDRPLSPQTRTDHGCPHDCGLCPDHEQHSCLAIIEVNEACNLSCPVCFAESSVKRSGHRDLATIERMLDTWSKAKANRTSCRSRAASPRSTRNSSRSWTPRSDARSVT
jgi:uncharacterized radical SAM superfamily Fe-S cluster-containing enzyme